MGYRKISTEERKHTEKPMKRSKVQNGEREGAREGKKEKENILYMKEIGKREEIERKERGNREERERK